MKEIQKKISTEALQQITDQQAWHYRIVPSEVSDSSLTIYTSEEDWSREKESQIHMITGKKILPVFTSTSTLQTLLSSNYRMRSNTSMKIKVDDEQDFLNTILNKASELDSSDIHFERFEDTCRVRYRIDGKLKEYFIIKTTDYPSLVNKIKIRSKLDISEKRLPQDGRMRIEHGSSKFDVRVSILPTLYGEKIVLRLLKGDASHLNLEDLGMSDDQLTHFKEAITKPHGLVLISGPTGSGKTTTLYASLKMLNDDETNITTIEDPVEYTLNGINQVQLKEDIGLSFSEALRSFLRQDPDVIMLGEIRDSKTASMAIRAALTGHLVLSTIHTNSAWGIVSRLLDMDIPAFLMAGTLNAVMAQRLIRLLCPSCKERINFDQYQYNLHNNFTPNSHHYISKGCEACYFTGYSGRKAIYEIIPINEATADFIREKKYSISTYLNKEKIPSLSEQAFNIWQKGETSIEEIHNILSN